MSAVANRYKRGELVGVGFECDFAGVRAHVIAWENAQVERLRDDPVFTEGLIVDRCDIEAGCGGPMLGESPVFKLALRIAKLEGELAIARAFVNFPKESTPTADAGSFVVPEFTEQPIIVQESEPFPLVQMSEVIATHVPIEPTVTETPVEPIQEPVVEVSAPSESTEPVPALAPDLPAVLEEIAVGEVNSEVIEEIVEEAWKPIPGESESQIIRSYFKQFGIATPHKDVIEALSAFGIEVTSSQVLMAKKAIKQ
jgi:hypothetical protein